MTLFSICESGMLDPLPEPCVCQMLSPPAICSWGPYDVRTSLLTRLELLLCPDLEMVDWRPCVPGEMDLTGTFGGGPGSSPGRRWKLRCEPLCDCILCIDICVHAPKGPLQCATRSLVMRCCSVVATGIGVARIRYYVEPKSIVCRRSAGRKRVSVKGKNRRRETGSKRNAIASVGQANRQIQVKGDVCDGDRWKTKGQG